MAKAIGPEHYDDTTLLDGRVKLRQPLEGLRAGLDAVMVAAACLAKSGENVLDLGCNTGAVGLCVKARVPGIVLTGLDIQEDLVVLARVNDANATFIAGDLRDKTLLGSDAFDHVVCNPPYMQAGTWYDSVHQGRSKALGKKEGDATLQDWVDCIQRVVKPGGSVSLIHRADHADKIIQGLGTRFGGVEIWPLYPHAGEPANRIVIRALKNRKSPSVFHAGIVLHEKDGAWTRQADAVLRGAGGL